MAMAEPPRPHAIMQPPPPPSPSKSNLQMYYYGLVVVGAAAAVLVLYNLIIVKWCADTSDHHPSRQRARASNRQATWGFHNLNINFVSSFKYKKDGGDASECAVCLSAFEEGEELRQLPTCKHSFHAPCIDMWLYSHMDCPLCRSLVEPPVFQQHTVTEQQEHSQEGLLGPATFV